MVLSSQRRRPISFSEALRRWDSLALLAADLGCAESTVRSWVKREFIPALYFPALLESARRRGIGMSMRTLRELEAERVSGRAAIARTNRQHSRRARAYDYL